MSRGKSLVRFERFNSFLYFLFLATPAQFPRGAMGDGPPRKKARKDPLNTPAWLINRCCSQNTPPNYLSSFLEQARGGGGEDGWCVFADSRGAVICRIHPLVAKCCALRSPRVLCDDIGVPEKVEIPPWADAKATLALVTFLHLDELDDFCLNINASVLWMLGCEFQLPRLCHYLARLVDDTNFCHAFHFIRRLCDNTSNAAAKDVRAAALACAGNPETLAWNMEGISPSSFTKLLKHLCESEASPGSQLHGFNLARQWMRSTYGENPPHERVRAAIIDCIYFHKMSANDLTEWVRWSGLLSDKEFAEAVSAKLRHTHDEPEALVTRRKYLLGPVKPSAVAVANGKFVAVDRAGRQLVIIDMETKEIKELGSTHMRDGLSWSLTFPECVVADPRTGDAFVTDCMHGSITKFSAKGEYVSTFKDRLAYPHGLAFNARGNILVCETRASRVLEYTPSGEFVGTFLDSSRGLQRPYMIAVHSATGRVVVSDTRETLFHVYDACGNFLSMVSSLDRDNGKIQADGLAFASDEAIIVSDSTRHSFFIFEKDICSPGSYKFLRQAQSRGCQGIAMVGNDLFAACQKDKVIWNFRYSK